MGADSGSIAAAASALARRSSPGSNAFFSISVAVNCLLVLLLLRYFLPLRKTPAYLLVPVFLALALPASIILLVPIDLGSVRGVNGEDEGGRGIWLPDRALLVCWRIGYWLTFVLTWAILPLLGEYSDAGYLSPKSRFLYSLRSNGQYWMIIIGCSIVGAIYFIMSNGFHFTSLKGLVMALAYAWGLILAIYLMGHGLVALPRNLWRSASIVERLKRIQAHAPKIHEKLEDAIEKLDEYEAQVMQLRNKRSSAPREFQEWIEELADTASLLEAQPSRSVGAPRTTVPSVITEKYLADLTRRLKRARHAKLRFEDEWARLVSSAVFTQAILDASATQKLDATAGSNWRRDNFWSRLGRRTLSPRMRYHWHTHLVPAVYYTMSIFLGLASAAVVWSEFTKAISAKVNIISRTVVHHPSSDSKIGFAGQCIAALWLLYMVLSALYAITEVKIWGNRALVRRQTYAESACWYSCQVAKLTVPLAYNFITFFEGEIYKETVFFSFLGKLVNLTPLGSGFSSWFPMLILIPVAATLFGLYGKAKRVIGLGEYMEIGDEDDDEIDNAFSGWREGRALIDREAHGNGLLAGTSSALGLRNTSASAAPHNSSSSPLAGSSPRTASPAQRPSPNNNNNASRSPVRPTGHNRTATSTAAWQQQRSTPAASAAAASATAAASSSSSSSRGRPADRGGSIFSSAAAEDAAEAEGGWLGDFTHRIRNTFETADFTPPRWMRPGSSDGSDGGGGGGGGARGGGNAGSSNTGGGDGDGPLGPLERLFGGGNRGGGAVRLR
ncbi:lmbr1 domain-containing protein [Diplodia corticola]|uniref:Lmbr1 domain-containing protein n=1 Tax=Diplodia corticola TaxID=236234 RepID=A0A1J9QUF2_9PEZI|nr:lmbr1 domain-containing protein [Diplodia corticola]OJD32072.1 lmbr1 domain-containing protein [Diplodia corticola]